MNQHPERHLDRFSRICGTDVRGGIRHTELYAHRPRYVAMTRIIHNSIAIYRPPPRS